MDRASFEQLAITQLDAVYRMAFHLSRRPDEADELVQEVFARAFRPATVERFQDQSDGKDPEGSMRAWLFAICHNVFYSRLRKQSRDPTSVDEFYGESTTERAPDEAPPAWDRSKFDWQQVDGRLKKIVEDLKPEFREVLLMWGVEGLKYREIAEILEVPIGTVMSRLHRARKLLSDALMGDEEVVSDLGLGRHGGGGGGRNGSGG